MTDCRYSLRISAYFDGETSSAEGTELEAHLAGCAECAKSFAELKRLSDLAASAPHPAISGELVSKLRNIPARQPWGDLLPTARFLLGLSSLLFVISVGFWALGPPSGEQSLGWEEIAARNSENEIGEEPEAEITQWVVAGLSERMGP